ncbi:LOW QUALITY PROTEIN: hypothetical protein Cgig2_027410 [Carnegiea gigantea]|uniref:Uncharacterized protein n=1 Tax=Carnegiea gigantea TaxID=171969 RepID=A0A9Q1JUC9_9CARY|nr:LOW QUALITY PROTEIN: hypothetical protein Cgig2_027410 [Carnegiea gigantea]
MTLLVTKGLHFKKAENVTMDLPSSTITSFWSRKLESSKEHFIIIEMMRINVSKDYENYFNATIVEKSSHYKKKLRINLPVSRLLNLMIGVMEWIKRVLAGIFGAIGIYPFSYHFETNVWRAFCELWGPLTNTLHHGARVKLAFHFMTVNWRFTNEDLLTIINILQQLLNYYVLMLSFASFIIEQTDYEKGKVGAKKKSSLCISCQERMKNLNVIVKGPTGFCYIYHGLGKATCNPDNPSKANIIFPNYYVIGWLAELFTSPYHCCPDGDFPSLVYYGALLGSKLSLAQARHIFRDGRYLSVRASSYHEDSCNGQDVTNMALLDEHFKFLLSIRSSVLPVRVRVELLCNPITPTDLLANLDLIKGFRLIAWALAVLQRQRSIEDWIRKSICKRVEVIISIISNHGSPSDLICWLSSKIEEIFEVVKTVAKIEELVDVDRVKALSDKDLTCSSEIAYMEGQLNNLSSEALKLKVAGADSQNTRGFDHPVLEKEKDHLKNLISFVISFKNV